jgi:hypothetical protein
VSNRVLWMVVGVLLMAAAFVLPSLNMDAPWFDEVITYERIGGPPFDTSRNSLAVLARTIPFWAPLYFVLASIWGIVAGNSLFALRYGSLLLGMLAVAWMYRLGADVHSRRTGLIAAILLATSTFFLHYWHDMRPYTLYVLVGILVLWTCWYAWHKNRQQLTLWANLSLLALFYTHFVGILLVASEFAYRAFQHWRQPTGSSRQLLRNWRGLFILFVPGIVFAANAALAESTNRRGMTVLEILPTLLQDFGNGLGWLMLALVAYAVFKAHRQPSMRYLIVIGGVYLLFAVVVNFGADYLFHMRHIMVLLPILLILMAYSLSLIWEQGKLLAVILILVWGITGLGATAGFWELGKAHIGLFLPSEPFEQAQVFIRDNIQQGDVVVFHMTNTLDEAEIYPTLVYYMVETPVYFEQIRTLTSAEASQSPSEFVPPDTPYDQLVRDFVADAPRVWLLMLPERAEDPIISQFEGAMAEAGYGASPYSTPLSSLAAVLYVKR